MNTPFSSWFSNELLIWYQENKRLLPWRESTDPYTIWLSEIIFQQTRIDQGTKYFLRFIESYPSVNDLAEAPDEDVMRLWEGLGYYNRARNLISSARFIVNELNGRFPENYLALLKLKGVGEYTAAAISSICFNEVQAAVDGNVLRVLSRFYSDRTAIDSSAAKKYYQALSQSLINHTNPGDYNQALMDLGSSICKPRNPSCEVCPIRTRCSAFKDKTQDEFPIKVQKKKVKERYLNYFFAIYKNNTLIRKRPSSDIWPDLFEFPLLEGELSAKDLMNTLRDRFNFDIIELPKPAVLVHLLSHQKLLIKIYTLDFSKQDEVRFDGFDLVDRNKLNTLAFPKPLREFLERVFLNKE